MQQSSPSIPELTPHSGQQPEVDPFDPATFVAFDDKLPHGQRWSRWADVGDLRKGPEPRPDWLITTEAIDSDLGTLKSGKEATCFLLERRAFVLGSDPADAPWVIMVGKCYRQPEHTMFHRRAIYTEGRGVRNTRDRRAMAKNTSHGQLQTAEHWANAEWSALVRLWTIGVPVPYPVMIDGIELIMEYICDSDGTAALRLAQRRPSLENLAELWRQLTEAMVSMTEVGMVHGDLSPYNLLVADPDSSQPRLVIIDVPQLVDLTANPNGFDLLHRDCVNVTSWFKRRGLTVEADELFAELIGHAL